MSGEPPIPDNRAVIGRIVDAATAVLLVGPDETELLLPADELPAAAREGVWVILDLDSDPVAVLAVDTDLTEQRARRIAEQMERIRRQQSGGRFPRR